MEIKIGGFQKLTTLDYPGKLAAMVFTEGCNFRCPFCQNSELVIGMGHDAEYYSHMYDEFMSYLISRHNMLEGVVISGGEPTINEFGLLNFIEVVREYGLCVKLDTNGTRPSLLKFLLDQKAIDYVAMDVKSGSAEGYKSITDCNFKDMDKIEGSISILKGSSVDYEFRTTVMKPYHTEEDIRNICKMIANSKKYAIQNYRYSENVINSDGLKGFDSSELELFKNIASEYNIEKVEVRD